jgi:hypothetical protein
MLACKACAAEEKTESASELESVIWSSQTPSSLAQEIENIESMCVNNKMRSKSSGLQKRVGCFSMVKDKWKAWRSKRDGAQCVRRDQYMRLVSKNKGLTRVGVSTTSSDKALDQLTAYGVIQVLECFYVTDVETVCGALRRFKHFCLQTEPHDRGWSQHDGVNSKDDAKGIIIPLDVFCRLVDVDDFYENQALQDDTPTLLRIREALCLEAKAYHNEQEDGFMNLIDTIAGFAICVNAVTMGLEADDWLPDDYSMKAEMFFFTFFMLEISLKIARKGVSWFLFGPTWYWNNFDMAVFAMGSLDIAVEHFMSYSDTSSRDTLALASRLARLGRLGRLARLLRFKVFEELKTMLHGVILGMRVLFWAVVLLFTLIYCLALIIVSTVKGDPNQSAYEADNFGSTLQSMFTLFRCFTDGCTAADGTPLHVFMAKKHGIPFMVAYGLVFLFVTMGLFNLIMAVFIEYVMTESLRRKQHERGRNAVELECRLKAVICELSRRIKPRESSQLLRIAGTVRKWLSGCFRNPGSRSRSTLRESGQLDRQISELNADLAITRPVFNMWLKDPDMLNLLDALDINMANLTDLFDVLDADLSGQLDVHELISGLMRLRGPPEKCDTIETLLGVRHMTSMLEDIRFRLGE